LNPYPANSKRAPTATTLSTITPMGLFFEVTWPRELSWDLISHPTPSHSPSRHTQVPFWHTPWPLSALHPMSPIPPVWQASLQSVPLNPGKQRHCPFWQSPFAEQLLFAAQVPTARSQAVPLKPGMQAHRPSGKHSPFPLQLPGHTPPTNTHDRPSYPVSHTHW